MSRNTWTWCIWNVSYLFTNLNYRNSQNNQDTRSNTAEKIKSGQFFFKSKTNRFLYETDEKKKTEDPDKSFSIQFNNDLSSSLIQQRSNSVEGKHEHNLYLAEIKRNYTNMETKELAPFGSNIPRFMFKQVFYGEDLKLTPGPGYYSKEDIQP